MIKDNIVNKLLSDLLSYTITITPIVIAIFTTIEFCSLTLPLIIKIILIPLILIISFLFSIFIIRICFIPKLKPGSYKVGLNKGFLSWYLCLALARSIRMFQIQELIYSLYFTKYLYWKAMGANIDFGVNSSIYIDLGDFPLLSIGKGSTITDHVKIVAHILTRDRLFLSNVEIGKNCFIGMHTQIGPRTSIKDNCYIGEGNNIFNKRIKENETIKDYQLSKTGN